MKTKSLIKALERSNLKVNKTNRGFTCQGDHYNASWSYQDGEACCVYVLKNGHKDELYTDYFPGFFAKKIKDVLKYLSKTGR